MADAGALKIKALLDTPSETLGDHMKALRKGLAATDPGDEKIHRSTKDSISNLLSYYRRVHLKIEDTHTSSKAKKDVTDALFRMEAALGNLSQGVKLGVGDDAEAQLAKAQRRASRAASDLARASRDLA